MESRNERHITNPLQLARLANTINTLVIMGRPINLAVKDVVDSFGLTKADAAEVLKLIQVNK